MSLKKRVLQTGAAVALSGLFAFSTQVDAEASSWQPNTVSEIEAEINSQSANEGSTEYTFKSGDTLWGISEAIGVPVNRLAQVNDIENSSMITVGNSIHLSSDRDVVSVERGDQVESYDVSNDDVERTETPQEVEQEAVQDTTEEQAAEQRAAEQSAAEQEAAEQAAAEQAQAAAEQEAAEQQAAEQQAAEEEQEQTETRTLGASTDLAGSEQAAKDEIARRESGGSGGYSAQNGRYIGKYQLTNSYLNGDYSPENQERTADAYVNSRYGSWNEALSFWNANGWY